MNIEIKTIEFLDKELQRVEDRRADVVAKIDDSYILHLEIQNNHDGLMHKRMLRYFSDIVFLSDLPVLQYVVYIGKEPLRMKSQVTTTDVSYKYNLIDMKKIDCERFIEIDTPDSLVLAILCDFKDKNPDDVVDFILKRLQEKTKDNEHNFRKYMIMLEELSENRDLKDSFKRGEKMLSEMNYKKFPSYELGFEDGEIKGEMKGKMQGKLEDKLDSASVMIGFGIKS